MRHSCSALLLATLLAATSRKPVAQAERPRSTSPASASATPSSTIVVSIVGTSDLHGHIETAPLFAGFLRNLRAARARDGGMVLIDAGDMWQGTIVSNMGEGAAVVRVYNALGYAAAAIGNHEFDYGPEGPAATPRSPGDDPRGAIKARARAASFPLLAANMMDAKTGQPVDWPGVRAFTTVTVAGVRIGIIGVSSEETLGTTIGANVSDLRMAPLADTIALHARTLRADHNVAAVVVAAHAGARCKRVDDPADLTSCDDGEVLRVARGIPAGLVDVIIGGHTHGGVAHRINGIDVIQSYDYGEAFGRVDLRVDRAANRVVGKVIHPPRNLCQGSEVGKCDPGEYEGARVVADSGIADLIADDLARAEKLRARRLGVHVKTDLRAHHDEETALGNLLADLMREANPGTDVALMNGGGIRADIRAGDLTYGAVYETFPFDNRFAIGKVPARAIAALLASNLQGGDGFPSISGVRARASCEGGTVRVHLEREDGKGVADTETLVVVASDYQALTKAFADAGMAGLFEIKDEPLMREAFVELLQRRGGELDATDKALFDPQRRRVQLPGPRPLRCP